MERAYAEAADGRNEAENGQDQDYLDSLAEKLETLGLLDESYVNQLCDRLEPVLGEMDESYVNQEAILR